MKKHIYDHTGTRLLRVEEAEPRCGDYCDNCGDCLKCYATDGCINGNTEHFWVVYECDDKHTQEGAE